MTVAFDGFTSSCLVPGTAFSQHAAEHVGLVGHEAVDAEVEQPVHLDRLVDGPDVYRESPSVCSPHESCVDQGEPAGMRRNLDASDDRDAHRHTHRRQSQSRDDPRAARSAQRVTQQLTGATNTSIGERADAHPLDRTGAREQSGQRLDHCVTLRVDVHPLTREGGQQLVEQDHGARAPDSRLADLGERALVDAPVAVGDPIEPLVVERDDMSVAGEVNICLEIAKAERHRMGERLHGVLGMHACPAAMSDRDRARVIEEGVSNHRCDGSNLRARARATTVIAMELAHRFAEIVRRPEPNDHLGEGALVIAACAQPTLSIASELARLDALAAEVRDGTLTGLLQLLFHDLGFAGNTDDYYDPGNSFLNVVVDRRTGIPISLAVLLIEVGRRAGVPLVGVGMPGHFLVRDMADRDVFIDAFDGGRTMAPAGCRHLFHQIHGTLAPFHDDFLAPVGRDLILRRMLANLRNVYVGRGDTASLLWVVERNAQFADSSVAEHRELADVLSARGAFGRAADTYDHTADLADALGLNSSTDRASSAALRARLN